MPDKKKEAEKKEALKRFDDLRRKLGHKINEKPTLVKLSDITFKLKPEDTDKKNPFVESAKNNLVLRKLSEMLLPPKP